MLQDDSIKCRNGKSTQSVAYFNALPTYKLGEYVPKEKEIPGVLKRLDPFVSSNKSISPGSYLVMVYGDNLFGKSSYRLAAVPLNCTSSQVSYFSNECRTF